MKAVPWLLRGYRLVMLVGIAWALHHQRQRLRAAAWPAWPWALVQEIFPHARQVLGTEVRDETGHVLGEVQRIETPVGYSGSSVILLGKTPAGAVAGVRLIQSADTPQHVERVRAALSAGPTIDAVSGATLTSQAIAEAVRSACDGADGSLRFPTEVSLAEAQHHFPTATSLDATPPKLTVRDAQQHVLGYLLRTSPSAEAVAGYAGPTETLLSLAPDGLTVRRVTLRQSYDTPSYVEQVATDPAYLKLFAGRTLGTLASLNFENEHIEGVSGSTQTSYAIAEGVKRRAAVVSQPPLDAPSSWGEWLVVACVIGACFLSYSKGRGHRLGRGVWQALLVIGLGLGAGQMVSLSLMAGWAQHGLPGRLAPGLILLVAAALLLPWAGRRQLYCHHLCPHGAAQSLLGKLFPRHWTLPPQWHRWLSRAPAFLLVAAVLAVAWRPDTDLAAWEAFDAWNWRALVGASVVIALVGLVASLGVPQAYCHYGCATGALLRYVRSPGRSDRFTPADALAGALLVLVWAITHIS